MKIYMKRKTVYVWLALWLALYAAAAEKTEKSDWPRFKLGGVLRFNYNYSDWKEGSRKRGGDFGYDLFKLDLKGSYKRFLLAVDYRFYAKAFGGAMLKSGWIGYQFDSRRQLQIGLTGVPFGIQPYGAHNYFFQISYYVGLEDDSDMGVKYLYKGDRWEYALAFFKNSDEELFGSDTETSADRYAYDVAGRNKEVNQFNGQLFYKWGKEVRQKIGASAEWGMLYNLDTRKNGTHFAFALHHELYWRGLSLKTQLATYAMYPKDAPGQNRDTVRMAAYGDVYSVAAKANIYSVGVGYTIPIGKGILKSIQFYNDFGWLQKWKKDFRDSFQNVTGCLIVAGPVLTYIDYALGKHQAWLGPDWNGFGAGKGSNSWHARLNVNISYYF